MSFEFDPNLNIDRAEDDNDRQKTWQAIWVVKDSMEEFQAVPKLKPQIDPKANP